MTIGTILSGATKALSNLSIGAVLNAALFVGVAGFTLYTLIKRSKRSKGETEEYFESEVDRLLGKNYDNYGQDFDEMDELSRELMKDTMGKLKKRKASKVSKRDIRRCSKKAKNSNSLQDLLTWAKCSAGSDAWQKYVDQCALSLGYPVDVGEDNIDDELRAKHPYFF